MMSDVPIRVEDLMVLGVLLVVLVIAGLVILSVIRSKQKEEEKQAFLKMIGFRGFPQVPEAVLSRLEGLFQGRDRREIQIQAVFQRDIPQGTLYFLDVLDAGEEEDWLGSEVILVVSPELALPQAFVTGRFALEERFPDWMSGLAEKAIDWTASKGGFSRLDLAVHPHLDRKLLVMGRDIQALETFFTPRILSQLIWLAEPDQVTSLTTGGDCFVLDRISPARDQVWKASLRALLDDARRALDVLAQEGLFS